MMTLSEREGLKKKLNQCKTVKEVFETLDNMYDLDNAEFTGITRSVFVEGAVKGIQMMRPKLKQ
jgi:hypothetical protein